jgi:uncharacterized membrane protein YfcA
MILFYIVLISFIATLVRSTFGFGESLVAVPLFSIFMPVGSAVPLSVMLSILVALVVVVQDHRQIHFNSAKWLIIFAIPGILLGVLLLIYGNELWIRSGLGILIIIYSLYSLYGKPTFSLEKDDRFWLMVCGLLSGVLGGMYGVNGPPLVIYGNMRKWSAKHFRATLQAYFLPASFIGLIGYVIKGLVDKDILVYFLVSLPAVIPAIFLGRYLNHKLTDHSFFKYVYWGLILIGSFLILDTFYKYKVI